MNNPPRRFRFNLRTLLVLGPAVAVLAAFPMTLLFFAWIAPLTGPAIGLVAFVLVWRAARSSPAENGCPSLLESCMTYIALLPVVGTWFVRHRWLTGFQDDRFPRPFPYPDSYLLEIHNWWDRLHPAGPGELKIHGEFYAVLLATNVQFMLACAVCGAACGYIFRNRDFVAAARRLTGHDRNSRGLGES